MSEILKFFDYEEFFKNAFVRLDNKIYSSLEYALFVRLNLFFPSGKLLKSQNLLKMCKNFVHPTMRFQKKINMIKEETIFCKRIAQAQQSLQKTIGNKILIAVKIALCFGQTNIIGKSLI